MLVAVEFQQFVEMQGESLGTDADDLSVGVDLDGSAAPVDVQGRGAARAFGRRLRTGDASAVQADVPG